MARTFVPGAWVPDAPGRLRAMAATMRALRKTAREPGADLVEIAVPEPREGEVLVKVHGASICGTDLHIYDWNEWADKRIPQVPMTFGHEVAGTVVAVGDEVHHLQRRRVHRRRNPHRVRPLPHLPDGACPHLREPEDPGGGHGRGVRRIRRRPGAERMDRGRGDRSGRRLDHGTLRQRGARLVRHGRRRGHRHQRGGGDRVRADRHVRGRDREVARRVEGDRDRTQRVPARQGGRDGRRCRARSHGDRPRAGGHGSDAGIGSRGGARDERQRARDRPGNEDAGPRWTDVVARPARRVGHAGPERSGHLQGSAAPRDHRPRDVPYLAADHDVALDGARRRCLRHHASLPVGAIRRSVRDDGVGQRRQGDHVPRR